MAHIDDLIQRIADKNLRDQVAGEVGKILERKDFGLVFQRHLPEDIEVPGVRPRRGDEVRLRNDVDKQNHVVLSARAGIAEIVAIENSKQPIAGREPESRSFDELVVVKDFNTEIYPGLRVLSEINRGGSKPHHVVIEGENYHALETLLYTHERKVDVIYIDPPYNTGEDDWIYNDRYVSQTDLYRNSKWLSFIERRLLHARRLLKDTGVMIVAIGDDEHHRLRMLIDQIFGPRNFLANVVWQGSGQNAARYTAGGVDYMLMYAKDEERLRDLDVHWREPKPGIEKAFDAAAEAWRTAGGDAIAATKMYRRALRELRGELEPAVFRYDQIDGDGRPFQADNATSPKHRPNLIFDVIHPVTGLAVPTPEKGWRYSKQVIEGLISDGRVVFGPDEKTMPRFKRFLDEQPDRVPYPTFNQARMPGSKRLESILGDQRFPNPKDPNVLMHWLGIVAGSDAIVLDFFAGSGSTAEAVMRLNAADGGTRQAIIVTNNELGATTATDLRASGHLPGDGPWEAEGVFQRVTRPRIQTVATGIREDGSIYSDGLEENVAFFQLTYEDENLVALGRKFEAVAPLLWLKAGGVGDIVRREGTEPWALPRTATYGILFDTAHAKPFADEIAGRADQLAHVFVVTDSESAFQTAVAYLPAEMRVETTRLYADYLHSFKINGRD